MRIEIVRLQTVHLNEVVSIHFECFTPQNNYSMRLGKEFVRKTYEFFIEDEKSFGFVAIVDGKLVGVQTGRLDYYVDALNAYRKKELILAALFHPFEIINKEMLKRIKGKIFKKKYNMGEALSHRPGKTATLGSLCVLPNSGLGISDMLIGKAEEYCRSNDMEILRTGIARDNRASRFTFAKRNYQLDEAISDKKETFYYLEL